jgi:hypothetical protein
MSRFFTKSLHKKALECPTKLYYLSKPDEYDNNSLDDPFLLALAKGGFQVGELAKLYFPGGVEVSTLRSDEAVPETMELMKRENVTIYEPAIQFGDFLVRVDILVKTGDEVRIYEVKSKSIDPDKDNFYNKVLERKNQYKFNKPWRPYVYDIAFQTLVCRGAYPKLKIRPYLTFVDKTKLASVGGVNQKFLLANENGRTRVKVLPGTDQKSVGNSILWTQLVEDEVERITQGTDQGAKSRKQLGLPSFLDEAKTWAKAWREGVKMESPLGSDCRKCEFRTQGSKKSGFNECWKAKLKMDPPDGGLVIDLWDFKKSNELIEEGRLLIHEVTQEDLNIEDDPESGMTHGQRQWVQVEKASHGDKSPALNLAYLRQVMKGWKFPLHCIDFETTRVAIPFHAGRRPYEQIAFQFSHHTIQEDGTIAHAGEYLHNIRGEFPNHAFVRALKTQLESDSGTVFRYSHFENTVLCEIYEQLKSSSEPDRDELMAFIQTITKSVKEGREWTGPREMIDLMEIVKKCYYHPLTKGSNSIKYVLPAVLNESTYLQKRYGSAIYGSIDGILSANFKNYTWLKRDPSGAIIDPYKQLQPVFEGIDQNVIDTFLSENDELAQGGAAMTAFAMMQFTEMTDLENQRLSNALLRYCELDTLAMVMIIEHFFEISGQLKIKNAV